MKVSLGKPGRCFHSLLIAGLALALGAAAPAVAADVAEYRQWLGASGAQHVILDDYAPTYKATVVLSAAMSNVSANQSIFCCRSGTGGQYTYKTFSLFYRTDVGLRFDYNVTEGRFKGPKLAAGDRFSVVVSGTNMIVNGSASAARAFQDFVPGEGKGHLSIFATHRNGDTEEVGAYANMALYSMKIYDTVDGADGVLVKDLHPCVDTDGAYGLYDTVSGRIYYNDATTGSGTFSISPVVVDVNGNPVGGTSALDYPAGGAFVWDNATGSLANWTNAVNWTAKDGYPGLAAATATFGSATPEAFVSLGGALITNGTLYLTSNVTLTNGYLRSNVDITGPASGAPARLAVARGATLAPANASSHNWNLRGSNIAVDIQGVASNVTMDAFGPVQGTNVLFRVDGGTLVGANAPMLDTCTNFQFEVVNGGEARLGGQWVYQGNIAKTWKPARSGYAAKEGGVLVHNGGYGIPLTIGEGNYLVVSNAAFGTSQNSMPLTLGAKGNFADFHNARIGVDGANENILFKLTGVGNRLGFSGALQLVPKQCQFSASGRDGTIDFNQNGYAYILQAGITGSNNTFRVGRDAAVYVERLIDMANATNALVEVCGFCTNDGFRATFTIRNGSRLFVNGGTFCAMRDNGLVVTNGGVVAVAGESASLHANYLYARTGGTLEFTLPETPWTAAPVKLRQTAGLSDGSKIRVKIGDYKSAGWVEIPLVQSGNNFSPQPADLDSLLEVGKGLSEKSYLEYRNKILYLHTKYHKPGFSIIVK